MFSRFDRVPACDRRTDRQTDVQTISITCFSIADARKNETDTYSVYMFKTCFRPNNIIKDTFLFHLLNLDNISLRYKFCPFDYQYKMMKWITELLCGNCPPSFYVCESRSVSTTRVRVDGCQKMHPSSRAVNSARELGPWTRIVETDLQCSGRRVTVFNVALRNWS